MTGTAPHPPIVGSAPAAAAGPAPATASWLWRTEADTEAFARALAGVPQLRRALITLRGDLGAGKTTLVRHLLRALGVQGRIKSPTYAVVEPHEATVDGEALAIWHLDFYRFDDPREWEDAGLRDLFASPGLKLAEWPDKAAGVMPPPDLELSLSVDAEGQRRVSARACSAVGHALLEALPR